MRTILSMLILMLGVLSAKAQSPSDSVPSSTIDTSALLSELMDLLDSTAAPTSYVSINAGIGNRIFSLHNNQLNARQASTSTLVLTPSLGYFHKSGLSISAGASLLNDAVKGFGATQFSVTPAFNLRGNSNFEVGVAYTHYFVSDLYSAYASPVQSDLYGSVAYTKTWLQPGLAVGYSAGVFKQVRSKDTVINNVPRRFYDSVTNHLKSFTCMLNVSHSFDWAGVLHRKDALQLIPSLMLNMGSSSMRIDHNTNVPNLLAFLDRKGKLKRQINNALRAESMGLSIDAIYAIGKFSFNPQLYVDYYLPKSDEQRLTQVFTFNVSYLF